MRRSSDTTPTTSQRVRIGLTGLACVFVLVLLAAAFFGLARPEDDPAGLGATGNAAAPGNSAQPKDPLAELGVAPGASGDTAKPAPPKRPAGH